jgi:hypothetical protein
VISRTRLHLSQLQVSPGKSVILHTGKGTNTSSNLYWGRSWYVWNNTGDKATSRDSSGARPKPAPTKTVTVTARPKPGSAGGERRAGAARNCTPGYSPCLPPALDYDCRGGSGNGPKYTGPVRVTGSDPYDLDRDGDEKACEWS